MVQIVYDKIVNFCGMTSIPCVIVGAKNDLTQRYNISPFSPSRPLMSDLCSYRNLRQVSPDEGQGLAAENSAAWIETSAKNNVNVGTYNHLPLIASIQ